MRSSHVIAILGTALVSACTAKEAAKSDSASATQAGATASAGKYDPATHTATLHAKDFAFDAPDSIPAGWTTFHFINDGPNLHHAMIMRLDSGKTVAEFEAAMKNPGPPPKWAVPAGGANAPDPGGGINDATVNLEAGNYVMLCVIDLPDHVPHFTKGMVRPLKVTAASGPAAAEPTSDATIVLSDYSFTLQGTPTAGKHTFKITNKGPQVHEVELIRLEPGKTLKDAAAFVDKPAAGPPPFHALGGIAPYMAGTSGYVTFDLTPGKYALICFVPDAKDGKAHMEHGMVKEFEVK